MPSNLHFIVGRGSPLALQVRVVFVPMSAPVFNGGPVILGAAVNINTQVFIRDIHRKAIWGGEVGSAL